MSEEGQLQSDNVASAPTAIDAAGWREAEKLRDHISEQITRKAGG